MKDILKEFDAEIAQSMRKHLHQGALDARAETLKLKEMLPRLKKEGQILEVIAEEGFNQELKKKVKALLELFDHDAGAVHDLMEAILLDYLQIFTFIERSLSDLIATNWEIGIELPNTQELTHHATLMLSKLSVETMKLGKALMEMSAEKDLAESLKSHLGRWDLWTGKNSYTIRDMYRRAFEISKDQEALDSSYKEFHRALREHLKGEILSTERSIEATFEDMIEELSHLGLDSIIEVEELRAMMMHLAETETALQEMGFTEEAASKEMARLVAFANRLGSVLEEKGKQDMKVKA